MTRLFRTDYQRASAENKNTTISFLLRCLQINQARPVKGLRYATTSIIIIIIIIFGGTGYIKNGGKEIKKKKERGKKKKRKSI